MDLIPVTTSSEFRYFQHALMRKPPQSMTKGITTQKQSVALPLAQEQHQAYVNMLQKLNVQATVVPPDERFPDCHFVEDTAIVHKGVAIMTQPGAMERRDEGLSLRTYLANTLQVMELTPTNSTATIDGGDVLFMGNEVLIGISHRTNLTGAKALASALTSIDTSLRCHFIEFSGVLHLKSGFTALNKELLLGNPLIKLKTPLNFADIAYLPEEQAYAANALVINGAALYFAECHEARDLIAKANLQPIAMELSEFKKMDGSFTCLSLLW